jgi:hypothetical protein
MQIDIVFQYVQRIWIESSLPTFSHTYAPNCRMIGSPCAHIGMEKVSRRSLKGNDYHNHMCGHIIHTYTSYCPRFSTPHHAAAAAACMALSPITSMTAGRLRFAFLAADFAAGGQPCEYRHCDRQFPGCGQEASNQFLEIRNPRRARTAF